MKSKVFSTKELSEEFKKRLTNDINIAANLPIDELEIAAKYIPLFAKAEKNEEYEKITEELSKEINKSQVESAHLLSLLFFFAQFMVDDEYIGDQVFWADDLINLKILSQENESHFSDLLGIFSPELLKIIKESQKQSEVIKGVFPYFVSCDITIEERLIIDKEYEYGADITKYSPIVLGKTPIVSVHLQTDSNNNSSFFFQASPDDIKHVINKLYSALIVLNQGKEKE